MKCLPHLADVLAEGTFAVCVDSYEIDCPPFAFTVTAKTGN